ncbi:MAG: KAP family NTPase, partial [Candidatus Aminicenantes bacterium]|nr:KAP family NTPase [Candidatus Aminicenantes bacterium]
PWKFQFEESPAVSLLHQIHSTAVKEKWIRNFRSKRKALRLLNIASSLAGEIALRITTVGSIGVSDLKSQGKKISKEYFEARQLTSSMSKELQKTIEALVGKGGRLVFFIDDLDRCRTENALRLLEALKLFLNAHNCVYVLAIDIDNLAKNLEKIEHGIENPYNYLDKIFQLIYTLSGPDADQEYKYIRSMLERDDYCPFKEIENKDEIMARIASDLAKFMAENPRALKQFCNRFRLESAMMKKKITGYEPTLHIFLQFLQCCFPAVYELFKKGCCIRVNQNIKKDFDRFTWEWVRFLQGNGTIDIEPENFKNYFSYLPYSSTQRSLIESGDRFVRVALKTGRETIICIEAHPQNAIIPEDANLSDMRDLSGVMLRGINLSDCRL